MKSIPQSQKALIVNTILSNCEENGYSYGVFLSLWSANETARGIAQSTLARISQSSGAKITSPQDLVGLQFDAELVKNGNFLNLKHISPVGTLAVSVPATPPIETPSESQPQGNFTWQS